jgi:hypothetical protein
MTFLRKLSGAWPAVIVVALVGCGIHDHGYLPTPSAVIDPFHIRGKTLYVGDPRYLPRIIVRDDSPSYGGVVFRYTVREVEKEDARIFIGTLHVIDGEEVARAYTARSTMDKSDEREKGFLAVRDDIDRQLLGDREFLSRLTQKAR